MTVFLLFTDTGDGEALIGVFSNFERAHKIWISRDRCLYDEIREYEVDLFEHDRSYGDLKTMSEWYVKTTSQGLRSMERRPVK